MSIPGRCHIDAQGWLQGPVKIQHLWTPNRGTGFGTARGVVIHTEAGYEAGTVATFMNPAAQVSAFFSIAQDGSGHQYIPVGRGFVAWSQEGGNQTWRGIEDEDRTHPSIPMTPAQIDTFAQILEALSAYDGFPLQVTDNTGGQGLITHGDGGVGWGDHPDCPGAVRKAQRPGIVALAKEIRKGTPVKPTTVTADGTKSLQQLADAAHAVPSWLLRLTAQADGVYPPELAGYVNDVFSGKVAPTSPVPKGCVLHVPA